MHNDFNFIDFSVQAFAKSEEAYATAQPRVTSYLPVNDMQRLNIKLDSVPILRSPSTGETFCSREYYVYEDGIVVEDTYVSGPLTRADLSKTKTKKVPIQHRILQLHLLSGKLKALFTTTRPIILPMFAMNLEKSQNVLRALQLVMKTP